MRFYVCMIDATGRGDMTRQRRAYETLPRNRGLTYRWHAAGQASILVASNDPCETPVVAEDNGVVGVGIVRLDNARDLEHWSEHTRQASDHMELVLRVVARHGAKYVPQFLGDFSFVVWNSHTREGLAACDAFMVKKLYYARRNGVIALSSRAEALALDGGYDVQYLAERLTSQPVSSGTSPYASVQSVSPGSITTLRGEKLETRHYWVPSAFQSDPCRRVSVRDAVAQCRDLLLDGVRLKLSETPDTWAQLSGGLDSSAVVSITEWLAARGAAPHRLAGTVTYVDRPGTTSDEREYVAAVVDRWAVRNEVLLETPAWHEDGHLPAFTDQPNFGIMAYPRERRLCDLVRSAGGRVLLTGVGSDELFIGNMLFFSDWVSRGHLWRAAREMARRAAIGRVSFWTLAYKNALLPLLPQRLPTWMVARRDEFPLPPWFNQRLAEQYHLGDRGMSAVSRQARFGHKHFDLVVDNLQALVLGMDYQVISDGLDVRHPFLYRPLVEFALALPPELTTQPHQRKWIMREAMRGILPDTVRTRVGKGGAGDIVAWSLATQGSLLEPLVREPVLADLGVIDGAKLRAAFALALQHPGQPGRVDDAVLMDTLSVEAWLQIRSGRWPGGGHPDRSRTLVAHSHSPSS